MALEVHKVTIDQLKIKKTKTIHSFWPTFSMRRPTNEPTKKSTEIKKKLHIFAFGSYYGSFYWVTNYTRIWICWYLRHPTTTKIKNSKQKKKKKTRMKERKKPLQKHVIMSKRNHIYKYFWTGDLTVYNIFTRKHKHSFINDFTGVPDSHWNRDQFP